MAKKIFFQELEGTRRRARPTKGWKEEVERDSSSARSEKKERIGDRQEKIELYCPTGQSPQRTVVAMEQEEENSQSSRNRMGRHGMDLSGSG